MSLFKERAVNAKKLISLENTIIALKKQIATLSNASEEFQKLRAAIGILEQENADLKKQLSSLPQEQPKKRPGRRKATKNSSQES